jgi:3',5'-cyclic AMP phosphodiesterase CpdA
MQPILDRRAFLQMAGYGGVVFASGLGLGACATGGGAGTHGDFFFVQLSDTHWGYSGPANPDAQGTLPKAIAAINALPVDPDFIVFTGDLTHLTLDGAVRRERLAQFRDQVAALRVRNIRFLPGEHDASADHGAAYREFFGPSYYAFDHKGIHFVALDNVSDPAGAIGAKQLEWLAKDLAGRPADAPIVVLTHRPLFDLQPQWGWATQDGERALSLLDPFSRVTVFYGHIHQENHHTTGRIAHHSASSLIFPLPAPGSGPDHKPIAWDPQHPYRGLAWRDVAVGTAKPLPLVQEHPLA